jgi:hypothetical protein
MACSSEKTDQTQVGVTKQKVPVTKLAPSFIILYADFLVGKVLFFMPVTGQLEQPTY